MKIKEKKVIVLGYAKERFLKHGWREETSGRCYWCGRGKREVALRPFRMMWGKFELVNLACRKCYSKYSKNERGD